MATNWKKEYMDLFHVARNLQIALAQDLRCAPELKRNTDKFVCTLGKQLEDLIERIPDKDLKGD